MEGSREVHSHHPKSPETKRAVKEKIIPSHLQSVDKAGFLWILIEELYNTVMNAIHESLIIQMQTGFYSLKLAEVLIREVYAFLKDQNFKALVDLEWN